MFPNATDTGPLDGQAFDRLVFRPALKRAGIADFRWKDLRHTFATRLRRANVEIQTIRDLLGHTTTRMTERYSHAAPGSLHAAAQKLSRVNHVHDAANRDPATDPAPLTERAPAKIA
jgi:site-specific recombinase XerD